jgi:hypothetical protein
MPNITIVLLAMVPAFCLAFFVHEAGHALMGRLCGCEVPSFGFGLGRLVWIGKWRDNRIYFGLKSPMMGIAWILFPQIHPARLPLIAVMAAGVLANLLTFLVAAVLYVAAVLGWFPPWARDIFLVILSVSLVVGLPNLIPFTARAANVSLNSDGYKILQIIWRGQAFANAPRTMAMVDALTPFWQELGDTRLLHAYWVTTAAAWCNLGDAQHALAFCDKAAALPVDEARAIATFAVLVRGIVDSSLGKLDASAAAFDQAATRFAALNHEVGLSLVELARCHRALISTKPREALALVEAAERRPIVARRPQLMIEVLVTRLCAHAACDDHNEVQDLAQKYEMLRRRYAAPAHDSRQTAQARQLHRHQPASSR